MHAHTLSRSLKESWAAWERWVLQSTVEQLGQKAPNDPPEAGASCPEAALEQVRGLTLKNEVCVGFPFGFLTGVCHAGKNEDM